MDVARRQKGRLPIAGTIRSMRNLGELAPEEWAVISVLAIVGGVVLAVIGAPTWIYPVALVAFLFGLRSYLRRDA